MHDLALLRYGNQFSFDLFETTRLALVHRSFRSVSVRRNLERSIFSSHFPALGLLSLAHSLRTDAAAGRVLLPEIAYFDEEAYTNEEQFAAAIKEWLEPAARRIIATSSYTVTIDQLELFLERFDPTKYLLLIGGAHATTAPIIENIHIVARGEGGIALRHILNYLFIDGFEQSPQAKGLNFLLDGKRVISTAAFDRSIALLPSPAFAYDLLPREEELGQVYATNFKRMLGKRPMIYICTQGCSARCTFCSTYQIHREVARPIRLIQRDLEYLVDELGYDSIEFHDDDLFQHPKFDDLLEVIGRIGVPWFCYGRVDAMTPERANKMAAAGCRRVFLGLEAMDQETLDYFNKCTTVAQNAAATSALARAGIGVLAGFIIGAPHHTIDSILQSLERFLRLPLIGINCSILSPDPGTVEFNRARKNNADFQHVSRGINTTLRLVPDVDRFGSAIPIGLPSICQRVEKKDLNDLVAIVEAFFYRRSHIRHLLRRGHDPEQLRVVDAFLIYQDRQFDRLMEARSANQLNIRSMEWIETVQQEQQLAGIIEYKSGEPT